MRNIALELRWRRVRCVLVQLSLTSCSGLRTMALPHVCMRSSKALVGGFIWLRAGLSSSFRLASYMQKCNRSFFEADANAAPKKFIARALRRFTHIRTRALMPQMRAWPCRW